MERVSTDAKSAVSNEDDGQVKEMSEAAPSLARLNVDGDGIPPSSSMVRDADEVPDVGERKSEGITEPPSPVAARKSIAQKASDFVSRLRSKESGRLGQMEGVRQTKELLAALMFLIEEVNVLEHYDKERNKFQQGSLLHFSALHVRSPKSSESGEYEDAVKHSARELSQDPKKRRKHVLRAHEELKKPFPEELRGVLPQHELEPLYRKFRARWEEVMRAVEDETSSEVDASITVSAEDRTTYMKLCNTITANLSEAYKAVLPKGKQDDTDELNALFPNLKLRDSASIAAFHDSLRRAQRGERRFFQLSPEHAANFTGSAVEFEHVLWMSHAYHLLEWFRDIEQLPINWQDGFFHSIDNFVSVLMYGSVGPRPEREPTQKQLDQETARVQKLLDQIVHLERRVYHKRGFTRIFRFFVILAALCMIGFGVIWSSWHITTSNNLQEGSRAVLTEYLIRGNSAIYNTTDNANAAIALVSGAVSGHGSYNAFFRGDTSDVSEWEALLYNALVRSRTDAVHITSATGDFLGAYATSRTTSADPTNAVFVKRTGGSWQQCTVRILNGKAASNACSSWSISMDPRQQYWYSFGANHSSPAWSRLYPMVLPSISSPSLPFVPSTFSSNTNTRGAQLGLSLVVQARNSSTSAMMGTLAVDLSSDRLSEALKASDYIDSSLSYVVDSDFNVAASSTSSYSVDVSASAYGNTMTSTVARSAGEQIIATRDYLANRFGQLQNTQELTASKDDIGALPNNGALFVPQSVQHGGYSFMLWNVTVVPDLPLGTVVSVDESSYLHVITVGQNATIGLFLAALVLCFVVAWLGVRLSMMHGEQQQTDPIKNIIEGSVSRTKTFSGSSPGVMQSQIQRKTLQETRRVKAEFRQSVRKAREYMLAYHPEYDVDFDVDLEAMDLKPTVQFRQETDRSTRSPDSRRSIRRASNEAQQHRNARQLFQQVEVGHSRQNSAQSQSPSFSYPASYTMYRTSTSFAREEEEDLTYEERMFKRKQSLLIRLVYLMLFLILGSMLLTWVVWSGLENNESDRLSKAMEFSAEDRAILSVSGRLYDPVTEEQSMQNLFQTGFASVGSANETYDRLLDQVFSNIRATGSVKGDVKVPFNNQLSAVLPNLLVTNDLNLNLASFITHFYVGFPNGDFIGAQLATYTESGSSYVLTAKDQFTDNCYKKYEFQAAPADGSVQFEQSRVRDTSRLFYENPGCVFDPRTRPWYTAASNLSSNAKNESVWTEIYQFVSTPIGVSALGITAAAPIYVNGALVAVVAADINIDFLNQHLFLTPFPTSVNSTSFIIDMQGVLIATSAQEVSTEDGTQYLSVGSSNSVIRSTTQYLLDVLTADTGGLPSIRNVNGEPTRPVRKMEDPKTVVYVLKIQPSSDWLLVFAVPFDLLQTFDDRETRSFITCLGTIVCVIFVCSKVLPTVRRKVFKNKHGKNRNKRAFKALRKSLPPNDVIKREIEAFVVAACAHSWSVRVKDEHQGKGMPVMAAAASQPFPVVDLREHFRRHAVKLIEYSQSQRDIEVICELTLSDSLKSSKQHGFLSAFERVVFSNFSDHPVQTYIRVTSTSYRALINLVILFHIGLTFMEPDTYEDMRRTGTSGWVLGVEAIVLFIEACDIAALYKVFYQWSTCKARSRMVADALYLAVFVAILLDWIVAASAKFSVEYLVPLRPFLLVLRNAEIRATGINFLRTIVRARHVFLLYLFIVVIGAAMGVILFRNELNTDGPKSSYSNYIRAITTTFTFVSTGENYTEVVYPTFSSSPWYLIFWATFLIIGIFFVLALVIGFFQNSFSELRKEREEKAKGFRRIGVIAAFILLDLDGSNELSRQEFEGFMRSVQKEITDSGLQSICETGQLGDSIKLDDFVRGIELITWHRLTVAKEAPSAWRVTMQFLVFERNWFRNVRLLVVLCNIFVAAMYGVYDNEGVLDSVLALFILLYVAELALRVAAYGHEEFWNLSRYRSGEAARYETYSNRFDTIIILVSLIAWVISRIVEQSLIFDDGSNSMRFVLTFPLLRLFSLVKTTRMLVFTLIGVIPQFASVIVVMLVVFFVYGVVGVWMFAGRFKSILSVDDRPEGDFDSLSSALLTLFQLLVGEGWHDVMYAAVRTENGFGVTWYFVSFIVIVSILFTNVFIGLILDAFSVMLKTESEQLRRDAERIRNEELAFHDDLCSGPLPAIDDDSESEDSVSEQKSDGAYDPRRPTDVEMTQMSPPDTGKREIAHDDDDSGQAARVVAED